MHEETTTTPAGRGSILDRTGVQLAIGEQDTTIYADPHMVTDARGRRARRAAPSRRRREQALSAAPPQGHARSSTSRGSPTRRPRTRSSQSSFTGIGSYPEERRAYPQNTVAAPVIGYAGIDNKGLGGLELEYNHKLAGRPGKQTIIRDADRAGDRHARARRRSARARTSSRRSTAASRRTPKRCSADGHAVPRDLGERDRARSAHRRDPRDGAGAGVRREQRGEASRTRSSGNRAVTDTYEPGSTFKLVTIAGALSQGIVTPSTKFRLPYSIHVADRVIHDAEYRPTETLTMSRDPVALVERRRRDDRREARRARR